MPTFNKNAELLIKYVNSTDRNIFLTGKAGTGKTTLLKFLTENTHKNTAVAAPTGIAAINAGGSTLHSLLQLPFGIYLPDDSALDPGMSDRDRINTPRTVKSNMRMAASKRNLIRELDLLIIDEVSMLRADLTDCIDTVLRQIRRNRKQPFGGLQMLFIGDLNQLPPVIKHSEQGLYNRYYNSSFFFASNVLSQNPPLYIELEQIYRQKDRVFLDVLNRLRNNGLTQEDIELLNKHYKKDFKPKDEEGYIYITTHNHKADRINNEALERLDGESMTFVAEVEDDFPESMYPIPEKTVLKVGAKVMFVTNDPTGEKRFFNGKIGMVSSLDAETGIEVAFPETGEVVSVERYEWRNTRYKYEQDSDEIVELDKGVFRHYPLKLAHAVTVHKSQGLTFEKAVLDLSGSFAPGQMYVALSRLISLNGLVLSEPIPNKNLPQEEELVDFARNKQETEFLESQLEADRKNFILKELDDAFSINELYFAFKEHIRNFSKDESRSKRMTFLEWTKEQEAEVIKMRETGLRFIKVARTNAPHEEDYFGYLYERTEKACSFFIPQLEALTLKLKNQMSRVESGKQLKTYRKELKKLIVLPMKAKKKMMKSKLLTEKFKNGAFPDRKDVEELNPLKKEAEQAQQKAKKKKKKQPPKGQTKNISHELFKEGLTINQIAEKRELTTTTIEGHLAYFVRTGEIKPEKLIDKEKIQNILKVIEIIDSDKLTDIKSKLGSDYTFGEVKIGLSAYQADNPKKEEEGKPQA